MNRAALALLVYFIATAEGTPQAVTPAAGQKKQDPAATKLFAEARAARAVWNNFPGFTADIEVNVDGKIHRGKLDVKANGKVKVEIADETVADWAKREMASLVAHRLPIASEGQTPCAFADGVAEHPLGRAVTVLDDEMHSSFRIKDRQFLEVSRTMKDTRFTIVVLENLWSQEKQCLPVSYVVSTWDLKTTQLRSTAAFHNSWQRIGVFDLPASMTVVTATPSALDCRSVRLTNVKLP
jgi:hypothetical protein